MLFTDGGNAYPRARRALEAPVPHRILHEQQQHQGWHAHGSDIGRDCHLDVEAVAEARVKEGEIRVEQLEFVGERMLGAIAGPQRGVQQRRELAKEGVGAHRIVVNARRDRVQRVGEEVRLQLRSQRLQLAGDERLRERRRAPLARSARPRGVDERQRREHRREAGSSIR
jgi:hypothetical protein